MAILEREVKLRGGPEVLDRLHGEPLEPRRSARDASTACVLGQLVDRQRRRRERRAWS